MLEGTLFEFGLIINMFSRLPYWNSRLDVESQEALEGDHEGKFSSFI